VYEPMNAVKKIGVVGPCASGKSTLIKGMQGHELAARHIAQEHSYVPAMWQRLTNPDVLIFLDVSYEVSLQRRQLNWSRQDYEEQHNRLRHARAHAHLYLHTDQLSQEQVLEAVLSFLSNA
jgi:cytidylate kinase